MPEQFFDFPAHPFQTQPIRSILQKSKEEKTNTLKYL